MNLRTLALVTSLAVSGGLSVSAQQPADRTPRPDDVLTKKTEQPSEEGTELIYGRIKNVTVGQKIIIHVDNAADKTYDLTSKDRTIHVAEGLAVGDPVKVIETNKDDTKSVQIVRDTKRKTDQERSRTREQ